MIDDCFAGKIDYIITKSVSRFARNTVDCLDHVRQLKARGIGVYFEEQNIDTLKCDSELYLVIYAGFAQSESESMSKNITWSYRKNFEDGKCIYIYKKLLGYKKGADGTPEIVPEEAVIVERIFNMFLAGMTAEGISNILKAEKIEVPGKELNFSKKMILGILQNEKYCGDCILQKTVTVDCISKTRKKNEGEAPMYLVENGHPAIVSREVFNRVQEEISRRKALPPQSKKKAVTASGKYSKYALTEVLKCGECGSRYKRVTWTSSGKKQIVWRCVSRLDYGDGASIRLSSNVTLYAQWQINTYSLSFDSNGGTGSMSGGSAAYGENIQLPGNAFTRPKYTFSGWNTRADGSGTAYADNASLTLTEDTTLYAQWTLVTDYTVLLPDGDNITVDPETKIGSAQIGIQAGSTIPKDKQLQMSVNAGKHFDDAVKCYRLCNNTGGQLLFYALAYKGDEVNPGNAQGSVLLETADSDAVFAGFQNRVSVTVGTARTAGRYTDTLTFRFALV